MNLEMSQRWLDLLSTWSVDHELALKTFQDIERHYAEPGRFYHTLDHIRGVLDIVDQLQSQALHPNAVLLAAWLHDVIYDSKQIDNEERSAEYASRLCEQLAVPDGPLVASMILSTKTHIVAAGDANAQVLLDADLAILGASPSTYQTYSKNIRREYAWVSEPDYRRGRQQVLESFLNRPRIYHLLKDMEEPARRNITAEFGEL